MPVYEGDGTEYRIEIDTHWYRYNDQLEYRNATITPDVVYGGPDRIIYGVYRCTHCHEEFPIDIEAYVNSQFGYRATQEVLDAATDCHPRCAHCGDVDHDVDDGHVWCDTCDTYDCGMDEDEHIYCDHCQTYNCGRSHAIHDYSFKPRPQFLGQVTPQSPYYLGFELEVTSYSEQRDAQRITDWANANIGRDSLYCKHDGSVEGFEIVSHPMTPQFFESIDWQAFMLEVRANNNNGTTREPSGHGLHVHVSRTAFPNTLTLARWVYMWNARHNRVVAEDLCRRSNSSWAHFRDNDVAQLSKYDKAQKEQQRDGWNFNSFFPLFERYSLINLTNASTVEFRGFRSTRRADDFKRSIRSIYRSVDYVRTMQACHRTSIHDDYSLTAATAAI